MTQQKLPHDKIGQLLRDGRVESASLRDKCTKHSKSLLVNKNIKSMNAALPNEDRVVWLKCQGRMRLGSMHERDVASETQVIVTLYTQHKAKFNDSAN